MNDLFHALILIGLLMAFFAGIGNWRFGSRRSDFATFTDAMGTEFQACLHPSKTRRQASTHKTQTRCARLRKQCRSVSVLL
jgi:hypothetical protein